MRFKILQFARSAGGGGGRWLSVIDAMIDWSIRQVKDAPTEDVAPVVHARWIRWKEPKVTNPVYRCSNCGFDITVDKHPNVSIGFWIFDFRYCLHCGAKMDEEVE